MENKLPKNKNDQKHGYWEMYYLNGKLWWKGNYVNGQRHGMWGYYNDEGELIEETFYII